MKTLVIGSGITGILTAYFLSKEGYDVTVIEKESYPSMKTSYANGGQISVSNSQVWNNLSFIKQVSPSFINELSPIIVRPKIDWDRLNWITKFLMNTPNKIQQLNTIKNIQIGLRSRMLYQEIIEDENIKFNKSDSGILHLYYNQTDINNAVKIKSIYDREGVSWDLLSVNEINNIEPSLQLKNIKSGVWTPEDWVGDIHMFSSELVKVLKDKYGVNFQFGQELNFSDLDYDLIVVCAGIESVEISKIFGDNLSIIPAKGYSITFSNIDKEYIPKTSMIDERKKLVISPLGDTVRIAGTLEFFSSNYDIVYKRLQPMFDWMKNHLPNISTETYNPWSGLRPMTPDMTPIIMQSKNNPKVWYNTGHGHLGWTQAAGTAELLLQKIKNKL
jgi:D-amino-acid dehydrogenase